MAFEPLPAVSGEQYKYEPLVIEHYGPPIPTFDELETKGSVPHMYRSSSKCVFFYFASTLVSVYMQVYGECASVGTAPGWWRVLTTTCMSPCYTRSLLLPLLGPGC